MKEIDVKLAFKTDKSNSTKGTMTVKNGEEVLYVDKLDIAKKEKRSEMIENFIEQNPGLDNNEIRGDLEKQMMEVAEKQINKISCEPNEKPVKPLEKSRACLKDTDPELMEQAKLFLQRDNLIECIIEDVHSLGVAGENNLIATLYIIGTSRLLSRPLAGIIMGISSSGKSFTINKVSSLFPKEAVLSAHSMSPKSLEYMPAGSLSHRFVVAGERSRLQDEQAAEATRALREMIGDGKLTKLTVLNTPTEFKTEEIYQEGPIAYVESTTLGITKIFEEDRTRFIILVSDESIGQTYAIVTRMAQDASSTPNPDISDSIKALHHTAQRLLVSRSVTVPFAHQLNKCLPMNPVEVRRTFGHLLSLIQAVAILYQYQRVRGEKGNIIATYDDYEIVRKYMTAPLARSLGCELTPGAMAIFNRIESDDEFTVTDVTAKVSYSANTVRDRLKELISRGQVQRTEFGSGRNPHKYQKVCDAPPPSGLSLPTVEELKSIAGYAYNQENKNMPGIPYGVEHKAQLLAI